MAKLALLWLLTPGAVVASVGLPARVRRVILHVPGGPAYADPSRRFVFFTPLGTQALWKPGFGTHWIVWTDGTIWPRHPAPGEAASWRPDPQQGIADETTRRRIRREAEPVYSQLHAGNSDSVGIEVSHSGHSTEPFPAEQVRSAAFLLRSLIEMSEGRLTPAAIYGHKDLDRRPAYVRKACQRAGCSVFVDQGGRPFAIRVDPPESLFQALAAAGLVIPRGAGCDDANLERAEWLGPHTVPAQAVLPGP